MSAATSDPEVLFGVMVEMAKNPFVAIATKLIIILIISFNSNCLLLLLKLIINIIIVFNVYIKNYKNHIYMIFVDFYHS
jgi:hypothetical protein